MGEGPGPLRRIYLFIREWAWIEAFASLLGVPGTLLSIAVGAIMTWLAWVQEGRDLSIAILIGMTAFVLAVFMFVIVRVALRKAGGPGTGGSVATEPSPKPPPHYVEHQHETFKKKTIILDGHKYIDCDFHDCTFHYNGGAFELVSFRYHGKTVISTMASSVVNTMELMRVLGFTHQKVGSMKVELPKEVVQKSIQ